MVTQQKPETIAAKGTGLVLLTLASAQFLMTLDSSVMNVSIATVAKDVGTTVTGIQTAITLYTLVMAMFMVTGGKVGSMLGRRRAFAIGCLIYGAGSLTTALAPNLAILVLGWSFLEGLGAALIMPAIVALVAGNFPPRGRPRAYGLVLAAGAIAIAVGPLIGGVATTYFSWRWVFVGEVLLVLAILALARRVKDAPPDGRARLDLVGTILSANGLGLAVFGVLRSSELGWVMPKPDGPKLLGVSPVVWLILGGVLVVWLFLGWERRLEARGAEPLVRPELLASLGIGALASQLGAVTVSAVPDEQSAEVGGLQNTGTNLGASIGTALAGSILIAALTASFLQGIEQNPAVPASVKTQANVKLAGGVPFISDADLQAALDKAGVGEGSLQGDPRRQPAGTA